MRRRQRPGPAFTFDDVVASSDKKVPVDATEQRQTTAWSSSSSSSSAASSSSSSSSASSASASSSSSTPTTSDLARSPQFSFSFSPHMLDSSSGTESGAEDDAVAVRVTEAGAPGAEDDAATLNFEYEKEEDFPVVSETSKKAAAPAVPAKPKTSSTSSRQHVVFDATLRKQRAAYEDANAEKERSMCGGPTSDAWIDRMIGWLGGGALPLHASSSSSGSSSLKGARRPEGGGGIVEEMVLGFNTAPFKASVHTPAKPARGAQAERHRQRRASAST